MSRRVAIVRMDRYLLASMLKGYARRYMSDAPADMEVLDMRQPFDQPDVVLLKVASKTFAEVPDGCVIPEITITLTQHYDVASA